MMVLSKVTSAYMWAGILCILLYSAGCGRSGGLEFVDASGKVLLDGVPLSQANIEFVPINVKPNKDGLGGSGAVGSTQEDGHFVMYTASTEGVQPGKYKVRVSKMMSPPRQKESELMRRRQEAVPAKYNNKTELEAEIGEYGNTELLFELSSN